MTEPAKTDLIAQLRDAESRIAELETARLRAETLFAVTQVLGKTLSLEDTFETILGQLQRVVPYDSSSVQVIQDNRLVIVGGRGFDDLQALLGVGFDLEDETNPSIHVLRSKRPVVFGDVSQHPHFASELHGGGRIRGWICAPLLFGDRVTGVITLDKFEADFYNEDLAELVTAFAAQAATAIENARLLETERTAREQAETLYAAAQSLGSTLEPAPGLRSDPVRVAQGRALRQLQRPADRRRRDGHRRRARLSQPRRTARTSASTGGAPTILPAKWYSGASR